MKSNDDHRIFKRLLACLMLPVSLAAGRFASAADGDYVKIMKGIASDIEKLGRSYPQLAGFSAKKNLNLRQLSIDYEYRTHEPGNRPGWAGSVPNPDSDGVWLHIDLHDPDSMAQLHTQPVMEPLCAGDKRVCFLILEGKDTKRLGEEMMRILKRRGIRSCPH